MVQLNEGGDGDDNQAQNPPPNQVPNQVPNQIPNQVPNQFPNLAQPPLNPFLPNVLAAPGLQPRPQLNWSHFKPKYAGKPDEGMEPHLLRTNGWMDTHEFPDQVKVQQFCLILKGEARLWYELLRPINTNWDSLRNIFRQQYSKVGNTREQLFHAWRSFHFDENAEMIDTYVNRIRQVADF